jgi:hypothetical protein
MVELQSENNFKTKGAVLMDDESIVKFLDEIYKKSESLSRSFLKDADMSQRVEMICRAKHASTRVIMACMLGVINNPNADPRKPYTEIKTDDCFSGRKYDEKFLNEFIKKNNLPCNTTTGFLTPAYRTKSQPLNVGIDLPTRSKSVVNALLQLLDDVAQKKALAKEVLLETVRVLIVIRDEEQARLQTLLKSLNDNVVEIPLSSEDIIALIRKHLQCNHVSRLPVLIVAAAYHVAENKLGERILPLHSHTAADKQTGAIGDIEICLEGDDEVVTAYEMKLKHVTKNDVDLVLSKIACVDHKIHNYIFISTEKIHSAVAEYVASLYQATGGIEITILDCLGFLRHFLHLFHRLRGEYLNAYQELVLNEPDSSVSQTLKEAFLTLRKNAEMMVD